MKENWYRLTNIMIHDANQMLTSELSIKLPKCHFRSICSSIYQVLLNGNSSSLIV